MPSPFETYRKTCTARLRMIQERRPVNGLNVEIGGSFDRCLDKTPAAWRGQGVSGVRWLASGGSALVFGICSPACPRLCCHGDGAACWWCSGGDTGCPHEREFPAECPDCKAAFISGIDAAVKP